MKNKKNIKWDDCATVAKIADTYYAEIHQTLLTQKKQFETLTNIFYLKIIEQLENDGVPSASTQNYYEKYMQRLRQIGKDITQLYAQRFSDFKAIENLDFDSNKITDIIIINNVEDVIVIEPIIQPPKLEAEIET